MTREARRWGAAAAAVLGLSVSGHLLGGGALPSAAGLTIVAILALVLVALLSVRARPWRARRLAPLLAVFQGIAHLILHTVSGTGPVPVQALVDPRHHGAAALHHHGVRPSDLASSAAHLAHTGDHVAHASHGLSPLMVTTHLLATVLLAWLLGPAVDQVRGMIRRAVPVFTPLDLRRPRTFVLPPVAVHATTTARTCITLRGPPRFAFA